VRARVVKVARGQRGTWYLDFCKNYRHCPFTVVAFERDWGKHIEKLNDLEGKEIEIYGAVQKYYGRTEIILRDPRQLDGEKSKYVPPEHNRRRDRMVPSATQHSPSHYFNSRSPSYRAPRAPSRSEIAPGATDAGRH
jgi:hypothetical protein